MVYPLLGHNSTTQQYSSCRGATSTTHRPFDKGEFLYLRFDHERSQNWSAPEPNCKAPPTAHSLP
jgi:hypothetical protein